MTDKVQKICEVIEKRYEYWKEKEFNSHSIESEIRMSECQHLLLMLGSMQEEPVSEDLEKEIKRWIYDPCFDLNGVAIKGATDYLTVEDIADMARHFADWQKEQMLKDAIEVEVKIDAGGYPYIPTIELYDYDKDVPLAKDGDKVKVIVIKEN